MYVYCIYREQERGSVNVQKEKEVEETRRKGEREYLLKRRWREGMTRMIKSS